MTFGDFTGRDGNGLSASSLNEVNCNNTPPPHPAGILVNECEKIKVHDRTHAGVIHDVNKANCLFQTTTVDHVYYNGCGYVDYIVGSIVAYYSHDGMQISLKTNECGVTAYLVSAVLLKTTADSTKTLILFPPDK